MTDTSKEVVVGIASEIFIRMVVKYDQGSKSGTREMFEDLSREALTAAEVFIEEAQLWTYRMQARDDEKRRKEEQE